MTKYTNDELNLLDAFAGAALMALVHRFHDHHPEDTNVWALKSYEYAEAMMVLRRKLRDENDSTAEAA